MTMIEIPVYSVDGNQSGSVQVDEQLLGGQVRPALLKQAYVAFHANRRQGTAATRARGEVAGSTRKLYRQKGTGRARRGAIRTNILRGGGVAFAKSPKDWRQGLPAKMRRLANRNALLSKILDNEVKIVDDFNIKAPRTAQFAKVLGALSINRSCLLALADDDPAVRLSARNIADLDIVQVDQLNAFDLLNHRYLVMSKATFERYLQELRPTTKAARSVSDEQAESDKEAA